MGWGVRPVRAWVLAFLAGEAFARPTTRSGEIATRLRERGGEPPLTDFIAWIWMHRPAPDWTSVDGA